MWVHMAFDNLTAGLHQKKQTTITVCSLLLYANMAYGQ